MGLEIVEAALKNDSCDAPGFSELERRNRARLEAFNAYSRLQSKAGADAHGELRTESRGESRGESRVESNTGVFDGDETEQALANAESDTLAVEIEEQERPLDLQTWRTLQRIVDEPPARPALPIARETAVELDAEPSVTVGDVISLSDWAEIRAFYAAEIRRIPFA